MGTPVIDSIKSKALKALDKWAVHFKTIGNGGDETPRFSQIMKRDIWDEESPWVLKSTQKYLYYELDLTEEENNMLVRMDSRARWDWWKQIRTEYLLEHHKTIKPY